MITLKQPIIGFEVHVELNTKSKMFCGCSAAHFGQPPNTQTCPTCLGLPGALPVPNRRAVEWSILLGLALHCRIAPESKFDRKHYFYPDLPKGYQISQYDQPLAVDGYVDTPEGRVGIERVHLEEDTGKLQHTTLDGQKVSLVDFNRSGVPLVEIVTKPDIHSASQALNYAKNLRHIIRSLAISDCDMEKGSLRLEANISWGLDLGYKVEVKNVNSFRNIGKSIEYELDRQKQLLEAGQTPAQETRGWHENSQTTKVQRTKETSADYRYFPEPDIPPMVFETAFIEKLRQSLPELPQEKIARWTTQNQLRPDYAATASTSPRLFPIISALLELKQTREFDINKILGLYINKTVDLDTPVATALTEYERKLQEKSGADSNLDAWVEQAIQTQSAAAADYQKGIDKAIAALIGQVMALSHGKADGRAVKEKIEQKLRKTSS